MKRLLSITALLLLSLLLLFYHIQTTTRKSVPQKPVPLKQTAIKDSQGLPVRLRIPAINVNSNIQQVGVNSKGEMDVPDNSIDVGWFSPGSRPGERGSAVITGHFNGKRGERGVFTDLNKLKRGDKLYIEDSKGIVVSFAVAESRIYDSGFAEEVFSSLDGRAYLNLVTCDGAWDGLKKSYSKRLVVFTELIE